MSKHTPGPYRVEWLDDENGWILDSRNRYLVEMVTSDSEGLFIKNPAERRANGRLFAGAPEMYELLKKLVEFFQRPGESSLEFFERSAHEFYLETGKLAPGKSVPAGTPELRGTREEWEKWYNDPVTKARDLIAKIEGDETK